MSPRPQGAIIEQESDEHRDQISEYNQVLYEDETISRFSEATTLWSSIANSRWFSRTNVILFLNKIDLFQQVCLLAKSLP